VGRCFDDLTDLLLLLFNPTELHRRTLNPDLMKTLFLLPLFVLLSSFSSDLVRVDVVVNGDPNQNELIARKANHISFITQNCTVSRIHVSGGKKYMIDGENYVWVDGKSSTCDITIYIKTTDNVEMTAGIFRVKVKN
jgi:hypothetical protein